MYIHHASLVTKG